MEVLSRTFFFDGKSLREAIHNTFARRGTELPLDATALEFTLDFYEDVNKIRQWILWPLPGAAPRTRSKRSLRRPSGTTQLLNVG
jgi:hypothetical protein